MVTKCLPAMHIADVYFHNWRGDSRYRIAQCDRCVGERTRIQHYASHSETRIVEFVQNRPLVVALKIFQFHIREHNLEFAKKIFE